MSVSVSVSSRQNRIAAQCATALLMLFTVSGVIAPARAQSAGLPQVVATLVGPEQVIFEGPGQGCDAHDIPDAPLRAYRLDDGRIAAFSLHYDNRRLAGASLGTLKIECNVVFRGTGNADPAKFDDRIWLASTWTPDGKTVFALGHAEYHGESHPGRCAFKDNLKCLWIATLALRSQDGGKSFTRLPNPLVAAPGMRADQEQGRHRGFFNPSNIVSHKGAHYYMVAQTGGPGQPHGVCLFRTAGIAGGVWRAFDGAGFHAAFPNPYEGGAKATPPCKPLPPFPLVPGSVTKHRASGLWLALFPADKGNPDHRGGVYARAGFYLSASRDLTQWSPPTLVMETKLLGDDMCGTDAVRAYPVLLDEQATTRNFEDVGDVAQLAYTQIRMRNCTVVHERKLLMRRVRISQVKTH